MLLRRRSWAPYCSQRGPVKSPEAPEGTWSQGGNNLISDISPAFDNSYQYTMLERSQNCDLYQVLNRF